MGHGSRAVELEASLRQARRSVAEYLAACADGLSSMADAHEDNEATSESMFTGTEV